MTSTRVPRRFVFLDTEAHRKRIAGVEHQTWRCGVTAETHWQSKEGKWSEARWKDHSTPYSLWSAVVDAARPDCRTVVVAHNLSYDLRIGDGLNELTRRGWSLEKITLSQGHVGFDAVKDRYRLVLVDSLTVLPKSVEELGKALCLTKPKLPKESDPNETWTARCRADVAILMASYLVVIDALRGQDLGCWARTGSGIAWNTLLRRHLSDKVLVHERDDIRQLEHDSSHGGRAEAWRWGRLRKGRWSEWDFELAYANVLADNYLPAYLYDETGPVQMAHVRKTYGRWRWLITADVSLSEPLLPAKDARGTYYPVGSLRGTWWDVELLNALDHGATVTPVSALRYRGARWLETWANWVMDAVADQTSPEAVIWGYAAKHFQRALVGRSSMRYRGWKEVGEAFIEGVSYMPLANLDDDSYGACLQINGRRWEAWERCWWDNALPQLLSSVIAHCRVNLWRAMTTAGLDHVVYVDTDALIVDAKGSANLQRAVDQQMLGSLRKKHDMTRLDIWAPRYVNAPGYTRIAGVSRSRRQVGPHRYEGESWERLPEALGAGRADSVIVRPVTAELAGIDWHRMHLADGSTAPYEVTDGVRTEPSPAELAG